jgi:hypothetical protein
MVVDSGRDAIVAVSEIRRRIAFRAHGALRFLKRVQGGLEDIDGALDKLQLDVAAYGARQIVVVCLSIRSLACEGEVEFDEDSVSFDFFAGLPAEEIGRAIRLANEVLDLQKLDKKDWSDRLRAYVAETERLLAYDSPLPLLRSPEGAFGLLRLTRRWSPVLDEFGLPPLLPSSWVPAMPAGES